jgi:hypothetical protein
MLERSNRHLRSTPMSTPDDTRGDDTSSDGADDDETPLGEVPEGLGADLYPTHLESLSRDPAFGDAVLSFRDASGTDQQIPLDEVASIEGPEEGGHRAKIWLRNGAIVLATGAVIAGAIATVRYRRRHK